MNVLRMYHILILVLVLGCKNEPNYPQYQSESDTVFTKIPSSYSNINFINEVEETKDLNFLNYTYVYNGGGVAVGDINNDGLEDIYFTSNQNSNKLYLNKGGLIFEDITNAAGVKDDMGWSTGVTMVDINNDGWLDIYVCKSGSLDNKVLRKNLLFVNQQNNTFKEEAKKYGLDGGYSFSIQSYFFDYDKDGDLDMYLVNHRPDFNSLKSIDFNLKKPLTLKNSDLLFRNDGGRYYNITRKAGVGNNAWGLSASIGDFNGDDWPDIYVANDFYEPDFLYINNQDGTFTDKCQEYFKHISTNSMGSDFADINNDLRPDLVVLDMMAADRKRGKENMATMSTKDFNLMVDNDYHHQYMANMLQLNNGANSFSEIGQLAGIAKTDWSWSPLLADFNNDGLNDLFVTNGIEHDLTNQDFRKQIAENIIDRKKMDLTDAIGMMPSTKLENYMFINNADYNFKDVSKDYGFDLKVNSNGAAYADLDNDGDLDLVINNQSDKASIYRNNSTNNFLTVNLEGTKQNVKGIGAKVIVYANGSKQLKEVYPSRGFQSSVTYNLNFGLEQATVIDSLKVIWDDNKTQLLTTIKANKTLELEYSNAKNSVNTVYNKSNLFETVSASKLGINFKHNAVNFDDYSLQVLLPQKQSTTGGALAVADVNGDGLQDLFIGNTLGYEASLYVQNSKGAFIKTKQPVFEKDKQFNDNNAKFFDADNDGDLDLYIASGNYSQPKNSKLLQDRLYINNGKGSFKSGILPKMLTVTKAIAVNDYDNDGDKDLFIGGRVIPGEYPKVPKSYLLENINGKFINVTENKAKDAKYVGLVNDAIFSDYDGDGDNDLILAGEWMPITCFNNDNGIFKKTELDSGATSGWYQCIKALDYDGDGDDDYLVGNFGENNKFHPSKSSPLHIYANYFDDNKSYDIALSKTSEGELFPVRGKECSTEQTPYLKDKITSYKEFADSNIFEVYGNENIKNALHFQVTSFSSYYIENNNGTFKFKTLPKQAQFAPTTDFEFLDINNDNNLEIIGIGGEYNSESETVRYDASKGYILDATTLKPVYLNAVLTNSNVLAIEKIVIKGKPHLILLNSDSELSILKIK